MKRWDGATWFLIAAIGISVVGLGYVFLQSPPTLPREDTLYTAVGPIDAKANPLQPARAMQYLQQVCDLGPRFSGSAGMQQQQEMLTRHFEALGGRVERQTFRHRHPLTGEAVPMTNLIVHWHPDRTDRLLLCAHYDTRPYPDRDPDPAGRQGVFVGANDGGSGVAVLMELAHLLPQFQSRLGVDFVLFDGEELVFDETRDPFFVGSKYFAEQYVQQPPAYRYQAAVLLDMVGDKHLDVYQEKISYQWRDSRPLVQSLWNVAHELGVKEFVARRRYEIRDDHLMLHDIAKIPACDIIDFDYGLPGSRLSYWHTRGDTPDKCSGQSLARVGWVVWAWLGSLR